LSTGQPDRADPQIKSEQHVSSRNGSAAVSAFFTPALGIRVTQTNTIISLGLVFGLVVFIASFADTQIALDILFFATLLSPEFGER
jgi:hypothetical protein